MVSLDKMFNDLINGSIIPVFEERYIEDEIALLDSQWMEFHKEAPNVFRCHFTEKRLTLSEAKRLKAFFKKQIEIGSCWFYGYLETDSKGINGMRALAERAGFVHTYNTEIGNNVKCEMWSLLND